MEITFELILKSVFLGVIPEICFLYFFMKFAKGLKGFQFKLLGVIVLCYMAIGFLSGDIWLYVISPILIYGLLKLFYKCSEIVDLFVFVVALNTIVITDIFAYTIANNLIALFFVSRSILLCVLITVYKFLNGATNEYKVLWNRRKDNRIKGITVRNLSFASAMCLVFIGNIALYMLKVGLFT